MNAPRAVVSEADDIRLAVLDRWDETAFVRAVALGSSTGAALPPWEAGARIRVRLPGDYDRRDYSLVDLPGRERSYVLGVRLEDHSRGGSRFMHNLTPGDKVWASPPRQSFPLHAEGPALLVAGGVGITPILSMARRLVREGREFALHYAGRRRGAMAFLGPLREICGGRLRVHTAESRLDLGEALEAAPRDAWVYVCGPARMIKAAREEAVARGWPEGRVRSEIFAAPEVHAADEPFEAVLAHSGRTLHVPADRSLLAVLREAGLEHDADCERGGCGMCRVRVLEGRPDHRDVILSARERARGDAMQACVSRALTPRLVLDL